MTKSRLLAAGALFLSFAWLFAGGCSSSTPDNANGPRAGNTGGSGGGGQVDPTKGTPDATGIAGGMNSNLNPLCGATGNCLLPDNDSACRGYVPPVPGAAGAGGGEGIAVGAGGESAGGVATGGDNAGGVAAGGDSAGGVGGMSDGAPAQGGAPAAGAGGEGGNANPDPGGLAPYSCQVTRLNDVISRQCVAAGSGKVNAPCFSAADCAPSLACVTENDAGRCLPYCCDQNSNCTSGSFCAERPLRKAASDLSSAEPPHVPVCVPADACSLEDQFPCPNGSECRCKGDTACMVVRDDGTTTCLKPGTGQQGEACPCAWNHVCSSVTHQCIKICRTDPTKDDCGAQKCQASSELPQNFGVCVGPLK